MYSKRGRPSIPPEHLLKASLLIALLLGAQRRPQLLPAELHEVFGADPCRAHVRLVGGAFPDAR